jgi:hypothetical protein
MQIERNHCTTLLLPGERKSVEPMAVLTAPARRSPKQLLKAEFAPWPPGYSHVAIESRSPVNHAGLRKVCRCEAHSFLSHSAATVRIRELLYRVCKCDRVVEWHDEAGLALDDLVPPTAARRPNDNCTTAHRFRYDEAEPLHTARQEDNIRSPKSVSEDISVDKAQESERCAISFVTYCISFDPVALIAAAGKEADRGDLGSSRPQYSERRGCDIMALAKIHPTRQHGN